MAAEFYDVDNDQRTEDEIGALRQVGWQPGCPVELWGWRRTLPQLKVHVRQYNWLNMSMRPLRTAAAISSALVPSDEVFVLTLGFGLFSVLQVSVDVPRTAPNVPFFHEPIIQKSLERLLYIWGIRWAQAQRLLECRSIS